MIERLRRVRDPVRPRPRASATPCVRDPLMWDSLEMHRGGCAAGMSAISQINLTRAFHPFPVTDPLDV